MKVAAGKNFDLVTGCDLSQKSEQEAMFKYRNQFKPLVFIMSPLCGSSGGWSYLNRVIHPETWEQSRQYALVLSNLCAEIADFQYRDDLDWIVEQPTRSDVYDTPAWKRIRMHSRTVIAICDQCQCGARNAAGEHTRKSSELWASDYDLVYYIDGLLCGQLPKMCNGIHSHLTGADAARSQVWPWLFAQRLAWGVMRLLERRRWQGHNYLYLPVAEGADQPWRKCPGCRKSKPNDHEEHTRIVGECKVPNVETVLYPCPGCKRGLGRFNAEHTQSIEPEDRCRIPNMKVRQHTPRVRQVTGAGTKASARKDPVLRPGDPEAEPAELDADAVPHPEASSSSAVPAVATDLEDQ